MKAKEFRLGNYVFSNMVEDTIQLSALLESQDLQIKPIPLTEEWLLNFGFESSSQGYNYLTIKKTSLYIYINDNGESGISIEDLDNDLTEEEELSFSIKLNYVHQLQNLYFALTNEELIIKQ